MLSKTEQDQIERVVAKVEQATSAEIKVVVRRHCWGSLHVAAEKAFRERELHRTKLRNAVLVFVVVANREFLIFGDEGIHRVVADDFWVESSKAMATAFQQGKLKDGILIGVSVIGEQLAVHFPASGDNPNEVSNGVVIDET